MFLKLNCVLLCREYLIHSIINASPALSVLDTRLRSMVISFAAFKKENDLRVCLSMVAKVKSPSITMCPALSLIIFSWLTFFHPPQI